MKLAYMIGTPDVARMPIAWVGDPDVILPTLGRIGYEGVELQVRDPKAYDVPAFDRKVKAAGLTVCAVSSGAIGDAENMFLASPEAADRRRAIDRFKSLIDLAAHYGVDASIGRFRGHAKWAPDRATGIGWIRAALEELLPVAEKKNVRIVLEPQHSYNLDTLNTLAETIAFIESFKTSFLKFEADIHHVGLVEKSIPAALVTGMNSGHMTFIQVSDANRLAPGMGLFNWVDVIETLRAVGYDGWVSVEAKQVPDSETVARMSYAILNGILTMPDVV